MSVSAVVPTFNGGEMVAEAIESVYAQTALPDELVVVDDGSTDDTPEILKRFEGRSGFRLIRQANGGPSSARNAGIEQATGEYVAFLDHDDLWRPEKLERQLAEFDSSWGMSFTAFELLSADGSEVRRQEAWDPDPRAVIGRLSGSNAIGPPATAVIRRDALQAVGGFEDAFFGEDWLLWLRIARAGFPIGYLPEALTVYRWHGKNRGTAEARDHLDTACEVFDLFGDRRLRAWWRLRAAIDAHENHDRPRARRRILEAARIRPMSIRPGWARLLF